MEILSWSWGETNDRAQGGGIFNDIVLVLPTGIPSALLFKEFCNGTSHPQFSIRTIVGEDPFGAGEQKVLDIILTDVIISSYQTGAAPAAISRRRILCL
jgi:type VI protein secretion system component Hcp